MHEALSRLLPRLTNPALDALVADVPWYRHLPQEMVIEDVREVLAANLRVFVDLLSSPRSLRTAEGDLLVGSAARRAEERFPLPVLLEGYFAGSRACWERLADLVESEDAREVVEIGTAALEYLQFVTARITEVYLDTALRLRTHEWEARAELCTALVEGRPTAELWCRAGMAAWGERTIVVVHTTPGPDDPVGEDPIGEELRARRRARILRDRLQGAGEDDVLEEVGPRKALVFLAGARDRQSLERVLSEVFADAADRWAAAWSSAADDARTAAAVRAAHDTADAAFHLGRYGRVHELGDLRLEVQLTRPGPARDDLVRLLDPLRAHPDLWRTLEEQVHGGSRAEIAQRLHVHRNTLDYRLSRIRDLVGLDPMSRTDALTLRAAVLGAKYVDAATRQAVQRAQGQA